MDRNTRDCYRSVLSSCGQPVLEWSLQRHSQPEPDRSPWPDPDLCRRESATRRRRRKHIQGHGVSSEPERAAELRAGARCGEPACRRVRLRSGPQHAGGRRGGAWVAMREGGTLSYLHGD